MEEILASIRRIIADDQAHSGPLPGDSVSADSDIDVSAITFDDDVLQAADTDQEYASVVRHEPQQMQQHAPPPPPPPSPVAAPTVNVAPPGAEARAPAAKSGNEGHQQQLLSSAADASAASAFQALSSVVLSRSPRTVDDLVQDMLRPMLKAWLDENLPPLVEKLVKAEIERISRNR